MCLYRLLFILTALNLIFLDHKLQVGSSERFLLYPPVLGDLPPLPHFILPPINVSVYISWLCLEAIKIKLPLTHRRLSLLFYECKACECVFAPFYGPWSCQTVRRGRCDGETEQWKEVGLNSATISWEQLLSTCRTLIISLWLCFLFFYEKHPSSCFPLETKTSDEEVGEKLSFH